MNKEWIFLWSSWPAMRISNPAVQAMKLGTRLLPNRWIRKNYWKNVRMFTNWKKRRLLIPLQNFFKKGLPFHPETPQENHRAYLEGESDAAKQLYNYVGLVALTNMSVLINGSSGTGKKYGAPHPSTEQTEWQAVYRGRLRFDPQRIGCIRFFGHVKGSFYRSTDG